MRSDSLRILNADLPLIPVYRRQHYRGMRPVVDVVHWTNDALELRWVKMMRCSARGRTTHAALRTINAMGMLRC